MRWQFIGSYVWSSPRADHEFCVAPYGNPALPDAVKGHLVAEALCRRYRKRSATAYWHAAQIIYLNGGVSGPRGKVDIA